MAHSGAETSVTFRRYILPASFVLSPHQPSPISDSVLGVGECDQQSFSRIWAAMGTSQFFFGKSESTCRFEGMKSSSGTCGKFLLNMNSFAHVGIKGRALDTAGSGLNFQVAGMARTLWNDYFAMAVTGKYPKSSRFSLFGFQCMRVTNMNSARYEVSKCGLLGPCDRISVIG